MSFWKRDAQGRAQFASSGTTVYTKGIPRLADGTAVFALGTSGTWGSGFLKDSAGRILVTVDATGARWQTGYLRHPSGALVISLTASKWQSGHMRDANGALSVTAVA